MHPFAMEAAMAQLPVAAQIDQIRRFNRFYTRQIGVLQEHLLKSPFSLTQVRILYELAHRERTTATVLCRELGLDAGYVSRILRGLAKHGLLERRSSSEDARQNELRLTAAGRKTFAALDQQSNEQVEQMLRALPEGNRRHMVEAMQQVERTLTPQTVLNPPYILRPPQAGEFGWVVQRHGAVYAREWGYDERFEGLVARIVADFIENFDAKRERCWIAEREGEPVGTVFLVRKSDMVAKLRLLLVEPSARGLGVGKRLVEECIRFARQARYRKIELWTQSELKAARSIYKKAGFRIVDRKSHRSWGRTVLVSEVWELKL
jgi:DNA-binding MarR family transcriptional regulator/GNAT superfamily N-acetyltransferase